MRIASANARSTAMRSSSANAQVNRNAERERQRQVNRNAERERQREGRKQCGAQALTRKSTAMRSPWLSSSALLFRRHHLSARIRRGSHKLQKQD